MEDSDFQNLNNLQISLDEKISELNKRQLSIDNEIISMIEPKLDMVSNITFHPIVDGVVDCAKYLKAPKKILWVLREFHNKAGEIKNLREVMKSLKDQKSFLGYRNTYGPIAKVSYAIMENCYFENNTNFGNIKLLSEYLKMIGIINIKKVPNFNGTYVNWVELNMANTLYHRIIQKQISLYQPEIIVCAGTHEFMESMDCGKALVIKAFHPSQRTITHAKYINDIMKQVKAL